MQPIGRNGAKSACAIVVSYNGRGLLRKCVESVRGQIDGVLVVDNGSDPETLKELRAIEAEKGCSVRYNGRNLGIAAALNRGVKYAIAKGYRFVLTLDDDSEATPGMVDKLLSAAAEPGPDSGIVAGNPFDLNAKVFILQSVLDNTTKPLIDVRTAISSGSLIDIRTFERVGFFDERLFLAYVDHDFCIRVTRAGFRIVLCRDAVLLHREGAKELRRFLGRRVCYDRYSKEARYYIARNAIHVLRRYPDLRFTKVIGGRWVSDLAKVAIFDRERFSKTAFILKGLWDGLTGRYGSLGNHVSRPGVGQQSSAGKVR